MRYKLKQYFVLICASCLLFEGYLGSGKVTIILNSFRNPDGKKSDDTCCDWATADGYCQDKCDHYFKVCLDEPDGSPTDMNQCRIGKYTTGIIPKNDITFSKYPQFANRQTQWDFPEWQGAVLVKVQVMDKDHLNADDLVELLYKEVHMDAQRSASGLTWQRVQINARTELAFDMTLYCDADWYGQECNRKCKDNEQGHYKCDSTGNKICGAGWTGENCDVDIDECQSRPCASPGGQCVDGSNGYTCQCDPGYTGSACETKSDKCASNPCQNKATCTDDGKEFECNCAPGFTGSACETKMSKCACEPCQNNRSCTEFKLNYTGFTVAIIGILLGAAVLIIVIMTVLLIRRKKCVCDGPRSTQEETQNNDEHMYHSIEVTSPRQSQRQTLNAPTSHHGEHEHAENQAAQSMEMTSGHSAIPNDAEDGGYLAPRGAVPEYIEVRQGPVTTADENKYSYAYIR